VLGALRRIKHPVRRVRDAVLMGFGLVVLANSRPYEGFVFSLPVAVALLVWLLKKRGASLRVALGRVVLPLTLVLVVVAIGTGYYFWRVTGNPFRMPYQINRDTYAVARYFPWQPPNPQPAYRHKVMHDFYAHLEAAQYLEARSPGGWAIATITKVVAIWIFFVGPALTVPLVMLPSVLHDRRTRFLLAVCGAMLAGLAAEVFFFLHYAAPITGAIFALVMQSMRHLRQWRWRGQPSGLCLVRLVPLALAAASLVLLGKMLLHVPVAFGWYTPLPRPASLERARLLAQLDRCEGRHLVIVRYRPDHDPLDFEWVYNEAEIDNAKVVWARDMGAAQNQELIDYFKDRHVWLLEPDLKPPGVSPYPGEQAGPCAPSLSGLPPRMGSYRPPPGSISAGCVS